MVDNLLGAAQALTPFEIFVLFSIVWCSICAAGVINVLAFRWRGQVADAQCEDLTLFSKDPHHSPWRESRCPACDRPIRWLHKIPVIGWFLTRGRCASCGWSVPFRYPAVEAVVIVGSALLGGCFVLQGQWLYGAAITIVFWALVLLVLIDWDTGYLPDELTLGMLWLGMFCALLCADHAAWGGISLESSVKGAITGYVFAWTVNAVFLRLTGQHAIGQGDFKLLAAIGAWVGLEPMWAVVFVAILTQDVAKRLHLAKRAKNLDAPGFFADATPLGPGLCVGGLVVLALGQSLAQIPVQLVAWFMG